MADGVAEQIEQGVLEEVAITVRDEFRRTIERQLDAGVELEPCDDVLEHSEKADVVASRLLFPHLGAREHEKRRGKPVQAGGFVLDVA